MRVVRIAVGLAVVAAFALTSTGLRSQTQQTDTFRQQCLSNAEPLGRITSPAGRSGELFHTKTNVRVSATRQEIGTAATYVQGGVVIVLNGVTVSADEACVEQNSGDIALGSNARLRFSPN